MNFFVTDRDPRRAAQHLDDKRVIKIILEVTQVLSTVLHERGIGGFYKPTHAGHPVTRWAASERRHAAWAWRYGMALCDVYNGFSGREHACRAVLLTMRPHIGRGYKEPLWFQNSARRVDLGLDFSHLDVCTAYRRYLAARWPGDVRTPVWTGRPRPRWARLPAKAA